MFLVSFNSFDISPKLSTLSLVIEGSLHYLGLCGSPKAPETEFDFMCVDLINVHIFKLRNFEFVQGDASIVIIWQILPYAVLKMPHAYLIYQDAQFVKSIYLRWSHHV